MYTSTFFFGVIKGLIRMLVNKEVTESTEHHPVWPL
jgi:hypothetical protein